MSPRALTLLDVSSENWKLNIEALNPILEKIGNRPLAIYAIAGPLRSGKSYLINSFINHLDNNLENSPALGFEWGETTGLGHLTRGIQFWSEPYYIRTDTDFGEVAVLLLDTQGTFDSETTFRENGIIFTLTCLLSSVLMFNKTSLINEADLQHILCFSTLAKDVEEEIHSTGFEEYASNLSVASKLMFIQRDFDKPGYEYGYHSLTEKPPGSRNNFFADMFAKKLELETRESRGSTEENKIVRSKLMAIYTHISSYVLPHPGKQFLKMESNTPDLDFEEHTQSFVKMMLSQENLQLKKIQGEIVTGKQFQKTLDSLTFLCNRLKKYFCNARSSEELRSIIEDHNVVHILETCYNQTLEEFISQYPKGASEDVLREVHDQEFISVTKQLSEHLKSPLKDSLIADCRNRILRKFEEAKKTNKKANRKTKNLHNIIKYVSIAGAGLVVGGIAGVACFLAAPGVIAGAIILPEVAAGAAAVGGGIIGAGGTGAGFAIAERVNRSCSTSTNNQDNNNTAGNSLGSGSGRSGPDTLKNSTRGNSALTADTAPLLPADDEDDDISFGSAQSF